MAKFVKNLKLEVTENGLELLDACLDDLAYARVLVSRDSSNLDWKDSETGAGILHNLAYYDLEKPIKLLLQHGANPNITNKNEETPLHWCANMNSKRCAKVLIEYKCNINSVDNSGSTPLHNASSANNLEMIPLLLDNGALVSLTDKDGLTAIELAAEGKSTASYAVAILLLRHHQQQGIVLPKSIKKNIHKFMSTPAKDIFNAQSTASLRNSTTNLPAPQPVESEENVEEEDNRSPSPLQLVLNSGVDRLMTFHAPQEIKRTPTKQKRSHKLHNTLKDAQSQNSPGKDRPSSPNRPFLVGKATKLESSSPSHKESPEKTKTTQRAKSPEQHDTVSALADMSVSASPVKRQAPRAASMAADRVFTEEDITKITSKSHKSIAETLFPKADFVPLLPALGSSTKYMDVIIAVEHCFDCESHNTQSLRHDSTRYAQVANDILFALIRTIIEHKFAIRLYALRTKTTKLEKLGGMEVTIAVNITKSPDLQIKIAAHQRTMKEQAAAAALAKTATQRMRERKTASMDYSSDKSKFPSMKGGFKMGDIVSAAINKDTSKDNKEADKAVEVAEKPAPVIDNSVQWATHQLFSKIETKSWPTVKAVKDKAIAFLAATLKECTGVAHAAVHHDLMAGALHGSPSAEEEGVIAESPAPTESLYKHQALSIVQIKDIQSSYAEWVERMKIPPKIERHKLDLDWPELFPGIDTHTPPPPSFYEPVVVPKPKHGPGPMLDLGLTDSLSKTEYENAVLDHFFVFDNSL